MPKIIQCVSNTFHRVYQQSFELYHISIENYKGITKPYQNLKGKQYPFLGQFANTMGSIILVQAIKGVLFMPKTIQFTCTTLLRISHKTFGLHYISFGI